MAAQERQSHAYAAEQFRMERRAHVAQQVKSLSVVRSVGLDGTMSRWLSGLLLRARTADEAIDTWRALSHRQGRTVQDFTPEQQTLLQLPDQEIRALFDTVNETLLTLPQQERSEHLSNDRYQFSGKEKRSLRQMRQNGMQVQIAPEHARLLHEHLDSSAECPILDTLKQLPILHLNGFSDSKVGLTIHDAFDHFWTYDFFDRSGLLQQYSPFLQSIGSPQSTDIFKREGELIASIAYEWRSSHTRERQFTPWISLASLRSHINKGQEYWTENQARAYECIQNEQAYSETAQRLCRMVCGILVELMEQRRKQGRIWQQHDAPQGLTALPLLDREYLALIIEGAELLSNPSSGARQALYHLNVFMEHFLIQAAQPGGVLQTTLTFDDLHIFDPIKSNVSPARRQWLQDHLFHTAERVTRCE